MVKRKPRVSPAEAVRLSDSQFASKPEGFAESVKRRLDGKTILPPEVIEDARSMIITFESNDGETVGGELQVPANLDREALMELLNEVSPSELDDREFSFYLTRVSPLPEDEMTDGQEENKKKPKVEIANTLGEAVDDCHLSTENVIRIVYLPRSEFTVRPVTRCAHSLQGHAESILVCEFSPCGTMMASAGGDCALRLWETEIGAPYKTLKRHTSWIQALTWSPCGRYIATGGMDGKVVVWRPDQVIDKSAKAHDGVLLGKNRKSVLGRITSLRWQPLHLCDKSEVFKPPMLALGDDKGNVQIYDVFKNQLVASHRQHEQGSKKSVSDMAWTGDNVLFSAGRDGTVVAYDVATKQIVKTLRRHRHWVNSLALSSAHVLRAGPYHAKNGMTPPTTMTEAIDRAQVNYKAFLDKAGCEILASASDDYFIYLYPNLRNLEEVNRLSGHKQVINHIAFSPDGRLLASASFDKSVRLWNGVTGRYLARFRNHVGRVYRLAWAPDSRWLVSACQDSTLKLWDAKKQELKEDLPGAADELFCVDWSFDGRFVGSAGRDRVMRIWRH